MESKDFLGGAPIAKFRGMTLQEALMFAVRHRLVIIFRDMKRARLEGLPKLEDLMTSPAPPPEEVIGVEMLIYKRNELGENIFGTNNPIGLELSQDPAFFPQLFVRNLMIYREKWKAQFGTELE